MSANNSVGDLAKPALQPTLPSSPPSMTSNSNSVSMIDSRNTYKVSPVKTTLVSQQQQQQQQSQDIVKIRLTKDESGKGLGYTKSIITVPPPAQSPQDKTDNKISPPKMSINLAQQPTLQLKTAQNKIVLVKMLPKMPPSGPQVVPAPTATPTSRTNLSPTTLALARSVQGLRPIPPVNSPPSAITVTSPTAGKTLDKKDPEPVTSTSSSVSLTSSNVTLTTSTSNTSSSSVATPCKSELSEESAQTLDQTESSMMDVDENDSINTSSVKMSREMRCLKASQSNSKILSEFMQDSSSAEKLRKRHKSRGDAEDSRSCGSVTPTSLKRFSLSGRDDEDLDESKGSPSLGSGTKRTGMRSANVEFSLKQRKFLSSIHQHSDGSDGSDNEGGGAAPDGGGDAGVAPKEEKEVASAASLAPFAPKAGYDKFCWRCKTSEPGLETCAGCIRCFHPVCLKLNPAFFIVEKKWNCPECIKLQPANDEQGSKDRLKIDSLTVSLKFALKRMQMLKGSNIFNPLDKQQFPHYDEYVTNHVDLVMIQKNVGERKYRTTDEFLADVSWILHNASIYPNNNKLLPIAKAVLKVCKQEINEIEACNECYFNANTCKLWFTEVCTKPHLLVWAKLKGFPFWPAKLMSVNSNQLVDVRFFGDHDRAWVPIKECLLFCEKDPNTKMQRRTNMAECMREAETYISKLKRKFGQFRYAEFRTQVEANRLDQHLEAMIPGVLKRVSENEDSQKAKLMLRIIKTADNFLSISPLSESPPSTSTPKAEKAIETTSPKRKCTEKSTTAPKSADTSIKEEVRTSISTPEPGENPSTRTTRKRKRSSSVDESHKPKESLEKLPRENRRRSSRAASTALNKTKEDERSGAATPEPTGPRCYTNSSRKRQSESPHPEPKQDKVESVVIQRKSDSWKTVPAGKKQKMSSKSSEEPTEVKEDSSAPAPDATVKIPEQTAPEVEKQPESANETASKETDKTPAEASKPASIAPVPLAPTEIKTEIVDEEPAVVAPPAVEPHPVEKAVEPPQKDTTTSVPETATAESTPQQLLPIKLEPLSDEETELQVIPSASGTSQQQPLNPNQVVIRTGNRIMVKDISRMTTTQITARAGQPVILTPVEKPKGLMTKVMPKVLPAGVSAQQKMRRSFPANQQQQQQSTITTISLNRTNPGGSMPTSSTSGPARNGTNMMHMVHIPSPLPTSSDHQPATANGGGTVNSQPPTRPSVQQTSNCDTTHTDGAAVAAAATTSATAGPSSSSTAPSIPTPTPDDSQHMMAGFITPSLAAAVTETIVSTPPKLQSRPSGALRSEGDCVYPSGAGPVSQILINNSYKMADFFRSVIEDTLADLSNNSGALEAKVKVLELEIEKLKHCHQQEISKLKHNSDLVLCEMRKNMDLEKTRLINEVRKQCEIERIRSVEEAKKKQWCVNCGKEALFYCCWNTSYCDYPCQQQHWATHMNQCTQSQFNLPSTAIANKPQQQQQQNLINSKVMAQQMTTPKITTVQTLNLNGRSGLTIQPTQQHSQQQQQQQQLIITSARGGAQLGKGQSFQRLR